MANLPSQELAEIHILALNIRLWRFGKVRRRSYGTKHSIEVYSGLDCATRGEQQTQGPYAMRLVRTGS